MAIAVEESGLHKRIALVALNTFGPSDRLLLLGFMVPTAFCSMWISNTATTAMMIPIIEAVLSEIEDKEGGYDNEKQNGTYGTFENKSKTMGENIETNEESDDTEITRTNNVTSRSVNKKRS